jgi:hypothetical protein
VKGARAESDARLRHTARVLAEAPNWAEQLTAIATAVLAVGVAGAAVAAVFAGQQVKEARRGRQAQAAIDFFRRWNEDALTESRRLIAGFDGPERLAAGFADYVAANAPEAFVLYRELDFFEQLAALERTGAFDIATIELMVGRLLVDRWDLWEPALRATHGVDAYPLFGALAERMRRPT